MVVDEKQLAGRPDLIRLQATVLQFNISLAGQTHARESTWKLMHIIPIKTGLTRVKLQLPGIFGDESTRSPGKLG